MPELLALLFVSFYKAVFPIDFHYISCSLVRLLQTLPLFLLLNKKRNKIIILTSYSSSNSSSLGRLKHIRIN